MDAEQFARTLAARGEIGVLFSRFLAGRVDLLPDDHSAVLADSPFEIPPVDRDSFIRALTGELADNGALLAQGLAAEPCWSVPGRCAYRTSCRDSELVVQIARRLPLRSEVAEMALRLRALQTPEMEAVLRPGVLRQFEEWVYIDEDPVRERGFLETLHGMRDRTRAEYPSLVPEFCTGRVLCWNWPAGEALGARLTDAAPEARRQIAEALMEQISLLSFIDGELDTAAMALNPDGRLIFRRVGRPVAIPVGRSQSILRYIAATLSENSAGAAKELIEIAGKPSSAQSISRLLAAMAQAQPQLIRKDNRPPLVRAFEGNWRAFASTWTEVSLFLNLLHRNLLTAGGCGDEPDFLPGAQAAVIGAMLRSCATDALERGLVRELAAGAGVLVELIRTIGRMAGELRDGADKHPFDDPAEDRETALRARHVRQTAIAGIVLVTFLVSLRWSGLVGQPWAGILAVLAVLSAFGLYWAVSRIG